LAVVALHGCGATEPRPATHADFEAIQRQEAILDEVQRDALEDCACDDIARGCAASARICEIAETVADADASARCRDAQDRCTQYRAVARRCECE